MSADYDAKAAAAKRSFNPEVIAAEIAEDLQAALDQFAAIAADLKR